MFCLTVDGEGGHCLRLPHHVLCHAGVGAYVSWGQTTDLQGVVLANLIPGLKQVFRHIYWSSSHKNFVYTSADDIDKSKHKKRERVGEEGIVR